MRLARMSTGEGQEAELGSLEASLEKSGERKDKVCPRELRAGIFGALARVTTGAEAAPDSPLDGTDAIICAMELGVRAVTWDRVKEEAKKDPDSRALAEWIETGCTGQLAELPAELQQYWKVRAQLGLQDDIPMHGDGVIVPGPLRPEVLAALHSAHQGVYGMMLRAARAVYWPGFSADIERTRARCGPCDRAALSQSNLPPVENEEKIEYAFQHVVMDHCQMNEQSYGVFADRYTN